MHKVLTFSIMALILYTLIQEKFKGVTSNPRIKTSPISTEATDQGISTNSIQKDKELSQADSSLEGNFLEKSLSKVLVNVLKTENGRMFLEKIIQPMNKPLRDDGSNSYKINNLDFINTFFKINTFDRGVVGPATCGHTVTIHYQIISMDNRLIEDSEKTYTLGFKPIIPGIDSIVVGMMKGQTRHAVLSPEYAFGNEKYKRINVEPDEYYKINVKLDQIINSNFIKPSDVKIFDDEISYKMPLLCGEQVVFDAKITRISDGQILYDSEQTSKKINITIGDLTYPLIFAYGLYGKIPIGSRTILATGKTFQGIATARSKIFPTTQLPENEYFMLELKNFNRLLSEFRNKSNLQAKNKINFYGAP